MPVSILISTLLIILLIALSLNVSHYRVRYQILLGDGGKHQLRRAIRAHGNSVEHTLPFIALLLFMEYVGANTASIAMLGTLFIITRVFYAIGMLNGPILFRQISSGLTAAIELSAALLVLWYGFN